MSTHTAHVSGATITYDIHGELSTGSVPLVLIGSPMDAGGFAALAAALTDRTVVTYDPRNAGRSEREDATAAVSPEQHAEDLHALFRELDSEKVDVFASSAGATNALALVARYPDEIRILVAHEPPAGGVLPDREILRSACSNIVSTYDSSGTGAAMAQFIALVMHRGQLDSHYLEQPAPDPAAFGLPTEDDGDRTHPLMSNLRAETVDFAPDIDALHAAPTRIVIGVGAESGGPQDGEMAVRAAYSVAALLGTEPVVFPGGHAGFAGDESGGPVEFVSTLRAVLA